MKGVNHLGNMGRTKEINEPKRNREEEPREMEKKHFQEKKKV